MASVYADEIESDLLTMEADLGNPVFTWDEQDYLCVPSATRTIVTPDRNSLKTDRMVTLVTRVSQFENGVFPKGQDYINYKNIRWTILQVDEVALLRKNGHRSLYFVGKKFSEFKPS